MLAVGPGYASPIFPAAGLSLVVVLYFGHRALLGVWLGSVVLNVMVALLQQTLDPITAVIALLIASGSTLQAWVGASLVNRWQTSDWRDLDRGSDAFLFLLLGGLLPCLLASAVGVTGLYVAGVIQPGAYIFSYLNWYVGDILGVLVFSPLLIHLLNKKSRINWKLNLLMPMLLILGLLWLAFYGATHWIIKEQQYQLESDSQALTKNIADRLLTHRELLTSLRNFIEVTPDFSFKQFKLFTRITLQDNPDIFALSFNDLVTIDQRSVYEQRISALSPLGQFQITERDSQGHLSAAAERGEYVPVRYIVPLESNLPAVGFDINAEPIRRDAINRAITTNNMAVTGPIQLMQEQKKQISVLEIMPVLDNQLVADEEKNIPRLLGFAVSVVKIGEMIEISTRGIVPSGLLFRITDRAAPKGQESLYFSESWSDSDKVSERQGDLTTGLRMGDRDWLLTVRATDAYLQQHRPLLAWFMGGVAIVITGLIQLLLISINGRMSEIRLTNEAVNASLDNLFNNANVPIIVWDSTNKITHFSKQFELLSGRSAEEVLAKNIAIIFRDSDINRYPKLFKTSLISEHRESLELPILHVNGTIRTVLWNVSSILGDNASPIATIAQGYDITELNKIRLEQESIALDMTLLVDTANAPIFGIDAHGRINEWNKQSEQITGYTKAEVLGQELVANFITDDYKAPVGEVLNKALEGEETANYEFPLYTKSGERVDVLLNSTTRRDASGKIVGVVGVGQDITELNKIRLEQEGERKEATAKIIQASKLATLGEMSTSIAHELNQPLNVIRMAAGNSRRKISKGTADLEYLNAKLERIEEQTVRAAAIIDHMRMFGREAKEELKAINARAVVTNTLDLVGEQFRLAGIDIVTEFSEDCPSVLGHSIQMEQVILNLLANARDAMAESDGDKKITLRVFADDKCVHITADDAGGGIPESVLPRIFDPFYTTKEMGKGTGLGLSVSYGIINDMNGTLVAENIDGGARFTITLPSVS
jgi:PAS domain S-box-containing protein